MVKRNRVLSIITLMAVMLFTASCLGLPVLDFINATPGSPEAFAFISNRDGESLEIYLMSLDGTNIQLLPSSEFNKFSVGYSDDLEKFSFVDVPDLGEPASEGRPIAVESDLKTMDRSDGVVHTLLSDNNLYINNLSGNGEKIVYQILDIEREMFSIYGINYDGTGNHFIVGDGRAGAFYPNISNDGTLVAYTLWHFLKKEEIRQHDDGICTQQWDGGGTPELLVPDTETQTNIFPAFSPDGTKMAFVTVDSDLEAFVLKEMDIVVVTGGSPVVRDVRTLYQSEDYISDLRYSTDGGRLLFTNMPAPFINNPDAAGKGGFRDILKSSAKTARNGDGIHIFSIDAVNGGDLRQLTEGDTWNFFNFLVFAG